MIRTATDKSLDKYENHLHENEARWFAVYTNYKREKIVRNRLAAKGVECYVPLQQLTRRYQRKVRQVELPLISRYIFVRIARPQYVPVLETPDVLSFVRIRKNLLAIPEAEIDLLRRIVGELEEITVNPAAFHPGDPVEIIGGQLTGLRGTLIEKRSDHNVVITLETLGYDLHVQVDPSLLRRAVPVR